MSKLFYIDVETTGTDPVKNGLVQIAGIIEINGDELKRVNFDICPFDGDIIEPEALQVIGKTEEEVRSYPDPREVYSKLIDLMSQYVDRYNRSDKFHFIGYNSRFDDSFIRAWFKKLNDNYYGSWFHWPAIDVSNLAAIHFLSKRGSLSNFKLMTVAKHMGLVVDQEQAHDALYDVEVTKKLYQVLVSGRDSERLLLWNEAIKARDSQLAERFPMQCGFLTRTDVEYPEATS